MDSGTPRVQYVYTTIAPGSLLSQMIYPNGQNLQYAYENTLDAMIGRPTLLADGQEGELSYVIEEYTYLGMTLVSKTGKGKGVRLNNSTCSEMDSGTPQGAIRLHHHLPRQPAQPDDLP